MTSSNILQQRVGEVTQRHRATLANFWQSLCGAPAFDPQALEALAASLRIHLVNIGRDAEGLYNSARREWDAEAVAETLQTYIDQGRALQSDADDPAAFARAVRADIIRGSIGEFLEANMKTAAPSPTTAGRRAWVDGQKSALTAQIQALRPYLQLKAEGAPQLWPEVAQALADAAKGRAGEKRPKTHDVSRWQGRVTPGDGALGNTSRRH